MALPNKMGTIEKDACNAVLAMLEGTNVHRAHVGTAAGSSQSLSSPLQRTVECS